MSFKQIISYNINKRTQHPVASTSRTFLDKILKTVNHSKLPVKFPIKILECVILLKATSDFNKSILNLIKMYQ